MGAWYIFTKRKIQQNDIGEIIAEMCRNFMSMCINYLLKNGIYEQFCFSKRDNFIVNEKKKMEWLILL